MEYDGALNIWIWQSGEPIHIDSGNARPMRSMNLADALVRAGHRVTHWTADFDHNALKPRFGRETRHQIGERLELRLIPSRGYSRSIGGGRLVDHAQLALHLRRALSGEQGPDLCFVGFPPIEAASVFVNWASKRRIPTVLDVKDAWPDVLERAAPSAVAPLSRIALTPYRSMARRTFRRATAFTSTTPEFLEWTARAAGRPVGDSDAVLPLTAPRKILDSSERATSEGFWDSIGVVGERPRVVFVGTLNSAFDFSQVAVAARSVDVEFVICGDGSQAGEVRRLVRDLDNVVMPGRVSLDQAQVLYERSTVALIPLSPHADFMLNITNKFYDSIANGLPILAGLRGALGGIVERENIGLVYGVSGAPSLGRAIETVLGDDEALQRMGRNAVALYERDFEFTRSYDRAAAHLVSLAVEGRNATC